MKKLFSMFAALVILATPAFAQTATPQAKVKSAATTQSPALKKDGAPDKRYKENKPPESATKPSSGTPAKDAKQPGKN